NGMEQAPFGIVGLETAFPLLYTHFVKSGKWSLAQLIAWLTEKPADVFGLPYGRLHMGESADLVFIDLNKEQKIETEKFLSKGTNTPFKEWSCIGWPVMTMFEGNIVWEEK
ncbi:MAG: amidohydrolase family protein, partial [Planococcaceae bacterium]|nr:amidohydrolase family protein [Planococcaceae bacterium]